MIIVLKSLANGRFVCADDAAATAAARRSYKKAKPKKPTAKASGANRSLIANRDAAGLWESFEVFQMLPDGSLAPLDPPPPPPPPPFDPNKPPTWPRPMPADIDTVNVNEVRDRVRWALQDANSCDAESYWMDAIVLKPEAGHTPGWTATDYWRHKIEIGDGAGKGYVWPPQ
jgi:hypothetical protein